MGDNSQLGSSLSFTSDRLPGIGHVLVHHKDTHKTLKLHAQLADTVKTTDSVQGEISNQETVKFMNN